MRNTTFKKIKRSNIVLILITLVIVFAFEIMILYTVMFPDLLKELKSSLSIIELEYLSLILNKIVLGLGIWAIFLFTTLFFVLYLVRIFNQCIDDK